MANDVPDGNEECCADKSKGRTTGLFSLSIHDFDFFREKAFVMELLSYNQTTPLDIKSELLQSVCVNHKQQSQTAITDNNHKQQSQTTTGNKHYKFSMAAKF